MTKEKEIAPPPTKEEMENFAKLLSMLVRATKGQAIDPETMIQKMVDVRNRDERSRFPTYPIVARQVYLRLGAKIFGASANCLEDWANAISSTMIAYKGQQWKDVVDMTKHASVTEGQQTFNVGPQQQAQAQKRSWFRRAPKPEPSEFEGE
jgi:hypothetical protein